MYVHMEYGVKPFLYCRVSCGYVDVNVVPLCNMASTVERVVHFPRGSGTDSEM